MGMSVDAYWKRRERREEQAFTEHTQRLAKRVQQASGGKLSLEFFSETDPQPYLVEDKQITVYDKSPRWPRSRSERLLYQKLLMPVRAAIAAGASVEQVLALLEEILLRQ